MTGLLGLSYLTMCLVAVHSIDEAAHANGPAAFPVACAELLISVAVTTALTVLYGRWPRRRWSPAIAVAVVVVVLTIVLLPLATSPGKQASSGPWTATRPG
jgi:hypothetical protein